MLWQVPGVCRLHREAAGPTGGQDCAGYAARLPPPLVDGFIGEHWSASVSTNEIDRHLELLGDQEEEEEEEDSMDTIM